MEKKQYLTDGDVAFLPVSEEYLTDDSVGMGRAEQICFPAIAGEACLALQRARQAGLPVTVPAARPGHRLAAARGGRVEVADSGITAVLNP